MSWQENLEKYGYENQEDLAWKVAYEGIGYFLWGFQGPGPFEDSPLEEAAEQAARGIAAIQNWLDELGVEA